MSDDKIVEVPVTLGKDYGITVEIKTGLAEGDKVVEKPGKELVPGLKVKIKQ